MDKMDLSDIEKYVISRDKFEISTELRERIHDSFRFLENFSSDKIIVNLVLTLIQAMPL